MDEREAKKLYRAIDKARDDRVKTQGISCGSADYVKAIDALKVLRQRQSLENLGRWVIDKCLRSAV